MSKDNQWQQWSKHVLISLSKLDNRLYKIEDGQNKIRIDIAMLKVKAGMWGAFGGLIPVIGLVVVELMKQ